MNLSRGCIGVVAEYNPFHNGHKWQLQQASNALPGGEVPVVVVMSGDFVQRGEPALISKWFRAWTAVKNGADLVLELPAVYSLSSAGNFAYGAINTLLGTGIVSGICFGSENENPALLNDMAEIISNESPEFKKNLAFIMSQGHSYPSARSIAMCKILKNRFSKRNNENLCDKNNDGKILYNSDQYLSKALKAPNLILALEYIKAINGRVPFYPVKRIQAEYHDTDLNPEKTDEESICSATAIRLELKKALQSKTLPSLDMLKPFIPEESLQVLNKCLHEGGLLFTHQLSTLVRNRILVSSPEYLRKDPDVSEGLEFRIIEAARNHNSWKEIVESSSSKRYTSTRISRILARLITGINEDYEDLIQNPVQYARVLAAGKTGMKLIRAIEKNSSTPLFTKLNVWRNKLRTLQKSSDLQLDEQRLFRMLRADIRSSAVRNSLMDFDVFRTEPSYDPCNNSGDIINNPYDSNIPGNKKSSVKPRRGERFY